MELRLYVLVSLAQLHKAKQIFFIAIGVALVLVGNEKSFDADDCILKLSSSRVASPPRSTAAKLYPTFN